MFLRGYTAFERSLEGMFLHYAAGAKSAGGYSAPSRIVNSDDAHIRLMVKADSQYIDWSSATAVRERAKRYFTGGEPFLTELSLQSELLSQVQKVRNRIAHDSAEALSGFKDVERARFQTERTFAMRPGQLLRVRTKKRPHMFICAEFLAMFASVAQRLATKV